MTSRQSDWTRILLEKIVKNSETVRPAPNLAWRFLATLKLFCGRLDATSPTMTSRQPDITSDFAWKNRRKFRNCRIHAKFGVELPSHPGINQKVNLVRWHHWWRHGGRFECRLLLEKNRTTFWNCPISTKLALKNPCHLAIALKVNLVRWHRWRHGGRIGGWILHEKLLEYST
jgi:hypothetical protein